MARDFPFSDPPPPNLEDLFNDSPAATAEPDAQRIPPANAWWTSWPAIVGGLLLGVAPGVVLLWFRHGTRTWVKVAATVVALPVFLELIFPTASRLSADTAPTFAPLPSVSDSPSEAAGPTSEPSSAASATTEGTPDATPRPDATPTQSATRAPTPTDDADAPAPDHRQDESADDATGALVRPADARGPYTVDRVVDGDTVRIMVNGVSESVRLIGINTPETVDPDRPVECYGPEASYRAHELLDGRKVWLESDTSQGERDAYGRLLGYIWIDGATMFNETILREGLAFEYTYDAAYRYQSQFRAAERDAVAAGAGLWEGC